MPEERSDQARLLHPAGWFNLEIIDHGVSKASTGNYSIFINFKPINPEYPNLTRDLWLSPKAKQKSAEQLRAIGFNEDDFRILKDQPTFMAGWVVRCQVYHDDYERDDGTIIKVARIGWMSHPDRGTREMVDKVPQGLLQFNKVLKGIEKTGAAATTDDTKPTAAEVDPNAGNVPF